MAEPSILDQSFNLTTLDGSTVEASTLEIQQLKHVAVTTATIFGIQFGLAFAVLAILLITSSPARFRTPIFYVNTVALVCDVFRCALQCAIQDSAVSNFVINSISAYDLPEVKNAQAMSIANTVFTLLLFISIEVSLVGQVHAIFAGTRETYHKAVLLVVVIVACLAVAFRVNLAFINISVVVRIDDISAYMLSAQTWAQFTANVTSVVSIGIISLIFAGKVARAIRARRMMGLKAFGALQIIFIISCQTLLFPVIFAVIAYFVLPGAQLQSFVETFVAILLPLSTIWAAANVKARVPARDLNNPRVLLQQLTLTERYEVRHQSQISLAPLPAAVRAPGRLNRMLGAERTFWNQYGSRNSVMEDSNGTNAGIAPANSDSTASDKISRAES